MEKKWKKAKWLSEEALQIPVKRRKVKSESEVAQSCPTFGDPMDCSLPGSSIHGIFQARVLEWDAIAYEVHEIVQETRVKTIPMERNAKNQNGCLRRPYKYL